MASVVFDHVVKRYAGDVLAVKDLNMEVKDKEFLVLVGPSGCGKSTALRMLAGLEEITEGTISIGGRVVNNVAPKDRDIAMVFQNYALYPHMTVYKNMAFGLKLRGMPKKQIDERVQEAAKILDIGHLLERKPKALSGGQRQRVAVARALAGDPRVVVADEPISMLDVSIRIGILNLILQLKRELGIAFLYITHDIASARYVADDVLVMYAGQIVEQGPVEQVLSSPLHPYTQLLLASVPDPSVGERSEIAVRKGLAAAAVDPPAGCRFVGRCPLAIDVCSSVTPELVEARSRQSARCHVTAPAPVIREDLHAERS